MGEFFHYFLKYSSYLIIFYWIIILAITIGIALLLRPGVLWYFKINKKLERQKETNRLLRELLKRGGSPSSIRNTIEAKKSDHSDYMPK